MLNDFDRRLEVLEGFETDYVRLLYYDLPKNFSSIYKTYHYTRFCTILSGEKHVTLDNKDEFTYGESNYLLLPANTTVHMDMDVNTRALVFELNDDLIKDVFSKVELEDGIIGDIQEDKDYFVGQNKEDIYQGVTDIFKKFQQREKNSEFLVDLYAQKLIFDLIQDKATHHIFQSHSDNPVSIALRYIHANINDAISIGNIAEKLYMSESNFSHLFKKIMGVTPGEYIKNKKLELAAIYLKDESVTDVAYDLGYRNLSYFIKIFREKYNITPKQYKLIYYE